jgi:hypothetical protein
MLHGTLLCDSRLCPFIRLGVGAARVDFAELYSSDYLKDIEIEYWHFAYGLGAGVRYQATPRLALSVICDGVFVPSERLETTSDDRTTGVFRGLWGLWAGLGLGIRL